MRMFRFLVPLLLGIGVLLSAAGKTSADFVVAEGWNLFQTDSAIFDFGGAIGFQNFEGVPLGDFDFGGTIGIHDTGQTDTIVQRLMPAMVAGAGQTDTIDTEIVALSLRSVNQFNVGGGSEFFSATINSSVGSNMAITFDNMTGGDFDSTLMMDILFTGENSGIMFSVPKTLTASDVLWDRTPSAGAVKITGVNRFLKGDGTIDQDFWPIGLVIHDDGAGTEHGVVNGTPEPSCTIVLIATTCLVSGCRRKRLGG